MSVPSKKDLANKPADDEFVHSQYKFNDMLQREARSGASYWYGEKWKTVNKCVFCDLNERYTIYTLDGLVLTTNVYPYITGHLMIVPKAHITHIKELSEQDWGNARKLFYVARKMLKDLYGIKGVWMLYREGGDYESSQKTVDHLHIQVLPYTEGLVEWHYREIKRTAFEVAGDFRRNKKTFENYLVRYDRKHA